MRTCAFTGHRPEGFIFGYDEENPFCTAVKNAIARQIGFLYDDGCRRFMTGCALGVDMWAGEAAVALREEKGDIEIVAAVPFKGHENSWTDEQKKRYRTLLENCDEVLVLSERYKKDAFLARDRYLVENADVILAVYDTMKPKSGTGYTVRYAMGQDKPIIILDPKTLDEERRNF